MSKVVLVAAVLALGACAPKAEQAPAADTAAVAAPAAADSMKMPADSMARDTTKAP